MADESSAGGRIVTFYSYKGGVGRTMALANVAWILASNGKKVLVVDWDLDSPGLHRYFSPFLKDSEVAVTKGITDLISDYIWSTPKDAERRPDWYREQAQMQQHAISLDWKQFPKGATLDFISAGRPNRDFSSITSIDWDKFYESLGGGQFLDALRDEMRDYYDYTLIDSRTGLSDIADICTGHLPDILVDCFTLNNQSMEGAAEVAQKVAGLYHQRDIRILPVPTRIDNSEKEKAELGLVNARALFGSLPKELTDDELDTYWASIPIPYMPFYAYEEVLAAFGDKPSSPTSMLAAYERLAAAITDKAVESLPPMPEDIRLQSLEQFTRRRQPPPVDIYISCVPEDRIWATWIERVLTQRGIRVMQHSGAANAGTATRKEAEYAATIAHRTIAILSGGYLRSPQEKGVWDAMNSIDRAGTEGKLIPIRVGEVRLEPPWSERVTVDLTRRSADEATAALLNELGNPPKLADSEAGARLTEPRFPLLRPQIWNVPARNLAFTGRNEILDRLHEELFASGAPLVPPRVLHGLGGVGKTQLAAEYAHRFMADYDLVWWVSAASHDQINSSLATLASRLNIHVDDSAPEAARAAKEALRRGHPDRWLLIFDNVDEPDSLREFLPEGTGHVLVTSQNPEWSNLAEPTLVEVFSRTESREHLQRQVPLLSDADADLVAEALGDLPLAVDQAAALLKSSALTAAEYVAQLAREFKATIETAMDQSQPPDYLVPIGGTYRVSFTQLRAKSPAAARLLELCSFFSPDPISMKLIYSQAMVEPLRAADARYDQPGRLSQLVTELARYSFVKVDHASRSIQIHRLVQGAVRAQLRRRVSDTELGDTMHVVHKILAGARPVIDDIDAPENWAQYELIWPHLASSQISDCDDDDARRLLIDRVRYLWKRGEFADALETGRWLEEHWKQDPKIGPNHRQTLYLRCHIGNVLRSMGDLKAAYEMDTQTRLRQRAAFGPSDPDTLQTAGGVAGDLRGLGRFAEARDMDEETYTLLCEVEGPEDAKTLSIANNLAVDLRLTGDPRRALAIDEQTLSIRERVLTPDNPYTFHSAAMLARDYRDLGQFQKSIDLLRRTYARYREIPGPDFVDTLRTAKSLAVSLRKMGKLDEAYELTRDTNERYEAHFPLWHPDALACKLNLACDLSAKDKKQEAFNVASEVLIAYQGTLGPEHPFTWAAENNIATYLRGIDRVPESVERATGALTALRDNLGEDHPFTLSAMVNLANSLHDARQFGKAEELQREAAGLLAKTLGDRHPDTLICRANMAVTLRLGKKTAAAERLRNEVIEALIYTLGAEHANVAMLREWRLQNRDLEAQPT